MTLPPGLLRQARAMSEGDLQARVRRMAEELKLLINHFPDSRGSWSPGFPDLFTCGPMGWRIVELKSETGTLSDAQRKWRRMLLASGQPYRLWRPRDLFSGLIASDLTSISGLAIARCITPEYTERASA